LGETSTKDELN